MEIVLSRFSRRTTADVGMIVFVNFGSDMVATSLRGCLNSTAPAWSSVAWESTSILCSS